MSRLLWVKADWDEPWGLRLPAVKAAIEAPADAVLVKPGEAGKVQKLGLVSVAAAEAAPGVSIVTLSIRKREDIDCVIREAQALRAEGKRVAVLVEVANKELERAAVRAGKSADFLIAVTPDWKVIPLENMIAELQRSEVKILAGVKDAVEAKLAVETLEVGSDGVLLDPRAHGPGEIKKVRDVFETLALEKLGLVTAKVKIVKPVGTGDRACVDTSSMMTIGEGMLVGSQAAGMFLVHSESLASEFVAARPFRVNAGAVHAYVRLPGGKTKYMSELSTGDEVLIVNAKGEGRVAIVGRVKIEKRPLLLVEAERDGEVFKTLLQNAETINLVGSDGKPISVAKLKPGDEILLSVERAGRHFGVKVDEMLIER